MITQLNEPNFNIYIIRYINALVYEHVITSFPHINNHPLLSSFNRFPSNFLSIILKHNCLNNIKKVTKQRFNRIKNNTEISKKDKEWLLMLAENQLKQKEWITYHD